MKSTVVACLAALGSAASSTLEARTSVWNQWFTDIVAEPDSYHPNNLTFFFSLVYADGTKYTCSTFYDLITGNSANSTCATPLATARVGFHEAGPSIQDWAPYVHVPSTGLTYTANMSTENPNYICGHVGTPGTSAKCFLSSGTIMALSL